MAPCAVKRIGEDAYTSGLVVIAVNINVHYPQGDLLVPGLKTECVVAFSRDTGGRVLRGSGHCRRLLLSCDMSVPRTFSCLHGI